MHARTLLVNVPEPAEVAAEMARLARPGGWVASMEPDIEHAWCYPPHPAFTRICEIFPVVFSRNGADLTIGRRVPELFRQAVLEVAGVEATVQMYPPGNSWRTIRLDLVRSTQAACIRDVLRSESTAEDSPADAYPWGVRAVGLPGNASAYGVGDTLEALEDLSNGVRAALPGSCAT